MRKFHWLLPVLLLTQGCAGVPFAEKFSKTFNLADPQLVKETNENEILEKPQISKILPKYSKKSYKMFDSFDSNIDEKRPENLSLSVSPIDSDSELFVEDSKKESILFKNPSVNSEVVLTKRFVRPYRLTIRLSSEDPSSPLEKVTQILKKANVDFIVEKIESISDGKSGKAIQLKP